MEIKSLRKKNLISIEHVWNIARWNEKWIDEGKRGREIERTRKNRKNGNDDNVNDGERKNERLKLGDWQNKNKYVSELKCRVKKNKWEYIANICLNIV